MKLIPFTLLAFLLTIAGSQTLSAQSAELATMNQQALVSSGNLIMTFSTNSHITVGYPYLHNHWHSGEVGSSTGIIYSDIRMKFEAVNGMLAIINEADSVFMNPDFVREFRYEADGDVFVFRNGYEIPAHRVTQKSYLRVLHETSAGISIYKFTTKEFKEAEKPVPYATNPNPTNSFVERNRYLVRTPDGEWQAISPGRRTIQRLFPDKRDELNAFVRYNNLDYTRDAHLKRIFEHMSGLTP